MNLLFTLLLFESVSGGELILVLLAVFLLFGPNKIPEIARGLAKGINDIKKATGDIQKEVNKTIDPIKKELQGSVENIKDKIQKEMNNATDPVTKELHDSADNIIEGSKTDISEPKTNGTKPGNTSKDVENNLQG